MRLGLVAAALAGLYVACVPAASSPSSASATGLPTPPAGDGDADGYDGNIDCDDADATVHPGARELTCDGRDNDCVGGDDRADCTLDAAEADYTFVGGDFTFAGDLDGTPGDDAVDFRPVPRTNQFSIYGAISSGKSTTLTLTGLPAWTAGDATGDGRDDLWIRDDTTAYLLAGPILPGVNPARDAVATLTDMEPYEGFSAFGHLDVDGDGLADLVDAVGLSCPGKLVGTMSAADVCFRPETFYHNEGNGAPGEPILSDDFTGDGVPDLITAAYGPSFDVLPADGTDWGAGPAPITLSGAMGIYMTAGPGDIDGDGYADLAATVPGPDALVLVRGPLPPGDTRVDEVAFAQIDGPMRAYALGDLDDDGVPEMTAMELATLREHVVRLPTSGEWDLSEVSVVASSGGWRSQFRPDMDVDADGRVDVAVGQFPGLVFTTLAEVRP